MERASDPRTPKIVPIMDREPETEQAHSTQKQRDLRDFTLLL